MAYLDDVLGTVHSIDRVTARKPSSNAGTSVWTFPDEVSIASRQKVRDILLCYGISSQSQCVRPTEHARRKLRTYAELEHKRFTTNSTPHRVLDPHHAASAALASLPASALACISARFHAMSSFVRTS